MPKTLRFAAFIVLGVAALGCGKNGNDKGTGDPVATKVGGGESPVGEKSGSGTTAEPEAPKRGPEHSVFSIWDNRLAMHHQRGGGLFIPGGSNGLVKYMRFGKQSLSWELAQTVEGKKVATSKGRAVGLHVPLTAEQAAGTPTIRMRVYTATAQPLGFRLNGNQKKEVTTQLAAGWSTAEVAIPEGALEAGENEILFFLRKDPISIEWMQVGGQAPGEATAWQKDGGFVVPKGGGFDAYVMVPEGGLVTGDVVGAGCQVEVSAQPNSGEAVRGALKGKGSAVALGALANQVVRLGFRGAGCEMATLTGASLVIAGAAPTLKQAAKPKHIVMWIMDSLRADRIPTFVPGARAETPVMDELAKNSVVFTQAYVQGNETKASHASIWTSTYPVKHKMIPPNDKISPDWYTVDEVAKDGGMFTSGVSANGYIIGRRGFGTKWDKYRNHIHEGGGVRADQLLDKAKESLAGVERDPWFLYIGTIDTHVSWRAKEPWFSRYDSKPYTGRFKTEASGTDIGLVAGGKLKVTDRDIERIRALYDSNISFQDQQVGEFLKWLDELGVREDTMVILTADHGDELFEDGRVGHGSAIRDSLVHVPLLIHYPKMFAARRATEGADTVDIVPTIAEVLGVKANDEWQGVSLVPIASGIGAGYPRMSFGTQYENAHVGRIGPWKLRVAGSSARFYNMEEDKDEMVDLGNKRPIERRFVSDAIWQMRAFNDEWRKSAWGNAANVSAAYAAAHGE